MLQWYMRFAAQAKAQAVTSFYMDNLVVTGGSWALADSVVVLCSVRRHRDASRPGLGSAPSQPPPNREAIEERVK